MIWENVVLFTATMRELEKRRVDNMLQIRLNKKETNKIDHRMITAEDVDTDENFGICLR